MTEKPKYDVVDVFQSIMNNIAELTDIALLSFIMVRNLRSGANTIVEAGLTSPNGGIMRNFPNISPNGVNVSRMGNAGLSIFGGFTSTASGLSPEQRKAALADQTIYPDGTVE